MFDSSKLILGVCRELFIRNFYYSNVFVTGD